ncbi:MAG: hypothetical protein Q9209_005804 [Squamulea sp. 1 TL-2023]
MPEGLPEGLLTTRVEVRGNLESVDQVDVEDIARLWKAYHTNSAIFAEDVGRRLENFFWRIWGNDRLLRIITGTLVAAIFSKISEGGYIRTTPTQSPRSSRSLGTFHRVQQTDRPNPFPRALPTVPSSKESRILDDDDAGDAEETETESTVSGKKKLPPRPPPILKKPKSISPPDALLIAESAYQSHQASASNPKETISQHSKTKTSERSGKTARFNSDEVKPSHIPSTSAKATPNEEITESQVKSKSSSGKRKAAVIASTGVSRRRPLMRQRPSQSSSSSTSGTTPAQMGTEPGATVIRVGSSFPRHSKPQTEPPLNQEEPALELTASSDPLQPERVMEQSFGSGPGARAIPSHTSFSSLPSILKKSSAAAVPASYQATGMMDFGQQPEIDAAGGPSGQPVLDDTPTSEARPLGSSTQPLPRTKSQLTMLLQRDRTSSRDR